MLQDTCLGSQNGLRQGVFLWKLPQSPSETLKMTAGLPMTSQTTFDDTCLKNGDGSEVPRWEQSSSISFLLGAIFAIRMPKWMLKSLDLEEV